MVSERAGTAVRDRVPAAVPALTLSHAVRLGGVVAALVSVLIAGCREDVRGSQSPGTAVPSSAVASEHTLRVGGLDRAYRVYRPASVPASQPLPLVVFLHGGFGSAEQAERTYGWDALADARHVIVAYPDGLRRAWNVGGGCCGTPGEQGTDDVGFVVAMVSAIRAATPVDPARLYATGISNGGMMAYRLACDTSLFAAIGPDSATLLGPCPRPAPVSVIHVHGTADRSIPFGGGRGEGYAHIDGPPVPDVIARWQAADDCAAAAASTEGEVTTSLAECPGGRAVELVSIQGAGHQWPGAPARTVAERLLGLDPPSTAIEATTVIWGFFAAHPRSEPPGPTGSRT